MGSRATSFRRWAVLVGVLVGVLVVVGVVTNLIVGFPILKTRAYRAVVEEYARARVVAPTGTINDELKWKVELPLPDGSWARLQAGGHMDVVRVQFPGDTELRPLYEYEDYSNPIAIRVARDILFVYWGESLFHTDHWLLVYDVRNRQELERRRVDPKDMPTEQ